MKIIENRILVRTKFLQFNDTMYEDKTGKIGKWSWVERPNTKDIVMIVPTIHGHPDFDDDEYLVIIEEFRIPINGWEFGFPAGLVDEGETIEEAIHRELKEETNLDVVSIDKISPPVYNSAGLTSESITIAFVTAKGEISNKNTESSEDIKVRCMNREIVSILLNDKNAKIGAKAWLIMNDFVKE